MTKYKDQTQHKKQFLQTFEGLARQYGKHRVFSDFVTMSSIAISQASRVAGGLKKEEQEENAYLTIADKYEKDVVHGPFTGLFVETVLGLEHEGKDWLGQIYTELEIGDAKLGQFLTPYHISKLMSGMVVGEQGFSEEIEQKGYMTLSEPTCGSGGMVLAFAECFREAGFNVATQLFVIAQDICSISACMCHIQLSLCGIPALILNQNSLTLEEPRWGRYTTAYYLMAWPFRLSLGKGVNSREDQIVDATEGGKEMKGYKDLWGNTQFVTRSTSRKKFDYVMTCYEKKGKKWRATETKTGTFDGAQWTKMLGVFERGGDKIQQEEMDDGKIKVTVHEGDNFKRVFVLEPFIQKYKHGSKVEREDS